MSSKILLLTLGGTIDAAPYSEQPGEYPSQAAVTAQPHARDRLAAILPAEMSVDWIGICAKDSKDLDDKERQQLAAAIATAQNYSRIIVTMGTDRMCAVAGEVASRGLALSCPVVFTGAIWPLANGARSDGPANLRRAAFTPAAPGVFITMGDVFAPPEHVRKDFAAKRFVLVE